MKFLFLNSAGVWGGNEKWTHLAATSLSKEYKVFLAYKNEIIGERYRLEKVKLPFQFNLDPRTIIPLISFVRKNNIDFIIPTKKRDYVIAGMIAKRCGITNVLRLGIVRRLGRNPYYNLIYNKLAHGIIVNAHEIKNVLLESNFMNEDKIRVIYNGIDTGVIEEKCNSDRNFKKPFPFVVTSVGRISKRKGTDILIHAFASFLQNIGRGNAGLILIGSGSRVKEYQKLISKLSISQNVIFYGYLNNPYQYIKESDIYITASQNEGISNSLLEAMYLGTPVISSNVGGVKECITHEYNGLIVNDQSVDSYVAALMRLYKDVNLRTKLGVQGKNSVMQQFTVKKMTDDIIEFCSSINRNTGV